MCTDGSVTYVSHEASQRVSRCTRMARSRLSVTRQTKGYRIQDTGLDLIADTDDTVTNVKSRCWSRMFSHEANQRVSRCTRMARSRMSVMRQTKGYRIQDTGLDLIAGTDDSVTNVKSRCWSRMFSHEANQRVSRCTQMARSSMYSHEASQRIS